MKRLKEERLVSANIPSGKNRADASAPLSRAKRFVALRGAGVLALMAAAARHHHCLHCIVWSESPPPWLSYLHTCDVPVVKLRRRRRLMMNWWWCRVWSDDDSGRRHAPMIHSHCALTTDDDGSGPGIGVSLRTRTTPTHSSFFFTSVAHIWSLVSSIGFHSSC